MGRAKLIIQRTTALKLLTPSAALAATGAPVYFETPDEVVGIINTIGGWLFTIFFALAIVFLVYTAFLYLTSTGNQERIGTAKKTLIYAIVAIVVALVAGGIPLLIQGIIRG